MIGMIPHGRARALADHDISLHLAARRLAAPRALDGAMLVREIGLSGVIRGEAVRTTVRAVLPARSGAGGCSLQFRATIVGASLDRI